MEQEPARTVRQAQLVDLPEAAELLCRFNLEYGDPAPPPGELAARLGRLLQGGRDEVLLAGAPAVGVAVLRFRPALWSPGLECYLAELYVVPDQRGRGIGRALMNAALELASRRGADTIDLGTSDTDTAAIALYESLGFTNQEGGPGGPRMLYYERELITPPRE